MSTGMRLVVVSAGLGVPSSTRLLADRLAAATVGRAPAEVQVVEVRDLAVEISAHLHQRVPGPESRRRLRRGGGGRPA